MKTIVSFLVFVTTISANSQNNDTLLFSQLNINSFPIAQTEDSLTALLGVPTAVGSVENEIAKENWLDYKYSDNSFYFFEQKMVSFNLRNNGFYFYNPAIKAGNNVSQVNGVFPNSYANREILDNVGFVIVDVQMPDGTASDSFVVINYNPTTDTITSIHLAAKYN